VIAHKKYFLAGRVGAGHLQSQWFLISTRLFKVVVIMKTSLLAFFLLTALCLSVSAASVKLVSPIEKAISSNGGDAPQIDLGVIGPGQKLEIVAEVKTGEVSQGGETDSKKEAEWDLLEVVPESLPAGWSGQNSLRYESPMKAFLVVAKNAPDGEYSFEFRAKDEFEGVKPVVFRGKAKVSREVLDLRIAGEPVKLESRQTGIYSVEVYNKGSANDVFEVSISGLPKAIEGSTYSKSVFVPFNSKLAIPIQVQAPETGQFQITIRAASLSSPAIAASKTTVLFAGTSLASDLRAAARGVLLFPTVAGSVYALLGLIAGVLLG